MDDRSIRGIQRFQQNMVIDALAQEQLATITLDFDGSVLGTCRHAEGVTKGFNKKKKGQHSDYPLNCTVAQTAQVPRYTTTIKCYVEERKRWRRLRTGAKYFEKELSLDSWSIAAHRFVFVCDRHKEQSKGVIQLDLFKPHDFNYRYKLIVKNKTTQAKHVVEYHEGRGTQERLFAELKTQAVLSYVPCNTWNANKLFLLRNVVAHNLTHELQMR